MKAAATVAFYAALTLLALAVFVPVNCVAWGINQRKAKRTRRNLSLPIA